MKEIDSGVVTVTDEQKNEFIANAQFLETTFSGLVPEYQMQPGSYDEKNDVTSLNELRWRFLFEGRQHSEHMISVWLLHDLKTKEYEVMFSKVKTNNIRKKMDKFSMTEFTYQTPAIQTLMQTVVVFSDFWEFNTLYFNMIQDIRRKILEKNAKSLSLSFVEHSTPYDENSDGTFVWYLMSNESFLGKFQIYSEETTAEEFIGDLPITKNHVLQVGLAISNKNNKTEGWLQIPVISKSQDQLDSVIGQIMNVLTLEAYFNNSSELSKEILTFLKSKIPSIQITSLPSESSEADFVEKYEMKFQYSTLILQLSHGIEDDLSLYTVQVFHPNQLEESYLTLSFKRMSKKDLIEFLTEQKLDKIFKSVFDDVMEIFQTKFVESREHLKTQKDLKSFTESPFMSAKTTGFKNEDLRVGYTEESTKLKRVKIQILSNFKQIKYVQRFYLANYNRASIHIMINNFFAQLLQTADFK